MADHLSRPENPILEELRDGDIDDNLTDEALMNISSNDEEEIPATASNKDRIKNLEASLGQLQDGVVEMKIGFVDKFQHLEDIVMKFSDVVLSGGDNYKHAGRSMFYSKLIKLEFPTYRGDEDPTE
nr:hypothetical protein [Tanacetum cinerariifolium]